jgi:PAS domain S-box-containing protein
MAETPPFDGSALSSELAEPEKVMLVGDFRFYFADELWEWSPEAARIHGYPALEMRPTTDQVMSHKHPDDRAKLAAALDHVRRTHTAISSRHRIIDAQGRARQVVVVSRELRDDAGNVIGNEGYYVDLTSSAMLLKQEKHDREQWLNGRLGDILAGRIVIEQVKGMLMLIYRLDDRQAFELLRSRSQNTNTKVRAFAEKLRDHLVRLDYGDTLPSRSHFDQVLRTAHKRTARGRTRY